MRNWAGNYEYRARRVIQPRSVEEVQQLVRGSRRLRVLGSRHSFNGIADTTGDHLSLAELATPIEIDRTARTVTVGGGTTYGQLCGALDDAGLALGAMASLPHISVAGAVATATHGSGDAARSLATAVRAIEVVRADGELVRMDRASDAHMFGGAVVSLGALGAVVRLTLDAEPAYHMRQDVYDDLPLDDFVSHADAITAAADSASFFTLWRDRTFHQVWLKRRLGPDGWEATATLHGARLATSPRHPIPDMDPRACTTQLGAPGPWHERLPHFRMDHTPSSGDELQSEYLVARDDLAEAVIALWSLAERLAPLVQVSEVRTIAADDDWLSPAGGRPSAAIHFTWQPDWPAVRSLLPDVERVLEPFAPRPHWGKLFTFAGDAIKARYPRLAEFARLARSHDPDGAFENEFLRDHVFGPVAASS